LADREFRRAAANTHPRLERGFARLNARFVRPLVSLFRIVVLILDNDCAPSYERDVETKFWSNH
jgi:hypothetical protein